MDSLSCPTVIDLIRWRALISPEESAFCFDGKEYSCSWLWERCRNFASLLRAGNVRLHDRILVVVANGPSFFIAFYGSILSGAVAVPVFPGAGTDRCTRLMQLSGSHHIVLPDDITEARRTEFITWSSERTFKIHWVTENSPDAPDDSFPDIDPEDIAFIQYTSGSTGFPKGIPITHRMLLTNVRQMVEAMKITSEDVFVSWLPVYHDMGLILNTMAPFYTRARLVLMEEGLHRVHSWLKTIEQHKGTFIAAPDIAYRLCVKSARNPADYDLSSLRVALNASEPVHTQTYCRFEEAFGLSRVMVSGYGLAEATVGVTMHPPGEPPRVDENGYVSSGKPLNRILIRIESDNSFPGNRPTGEILVKSPAQMTGYFNDNLPYEPFDQDGFLRTGDIGYLDPDGYLFVLARKKNIIIQAGHTLYPDDVEQVVQSAGDFRRVAAVGIEQVPGYGENLVIFAESRLGDTISPGKYHEMAVIIVQCIDRNFGIKPGSVFLVRPKTIPVTPNGKLQHQVLKDTFLNDPESFGRNILYPRSAT